MTREKHLGTLQAICSACNVPECLLFACLQCNLRDARFSTYQHVSTMKLALASAKIVKEGFRREGAPQTNLAALGVEEALVRGA